MIGFGAAGEQGRPLAGGAHDPDLVVVEPHPVYEPVERVLERAGAAEPSGAGDGKPGKGPVQRAARTALAPAEVLDQ